MCKYVRVHMYVCLFAYTCVCMYVCVSYVNDTSEIKVQISSANLFVCVIFARKYMQMKQMYVLVCDCI